MSINKQMQELVRQLKENTVVSVILSGDTNISQFKRRFSVVKTRAEVEGKLDFSIEELDEEFMLANYSKAGKGYNMTIVLLPYPPKGNILDIKTGEV